MEIMEQKSRDFEDFLESSVLLDETQYKEGYRDGYSDGLATGNEEGREVGLKLGFQAGEELGFYRGCVDVWKLVARVDRAGFSLLKPIAYVETEAFLSRLQKNMKRIEQLGELVDKYPLYKPENEEIQLEMMNGIRLKFRRLSTNLGVKLEYS